MRFLKKKEAQEAAAKIKSGGLLAYLYYLDGYEGEAIMVVKDIELEGVLVLKAAHCSCHELEETWSEGTEYTVEELRVLMDSWVQSGDEIEQAIVPAIRLALKEY